MTDKGIVLAVAAHPDDIEFCCAGTLALLHGEGYAVHLATIGNGSGGSMTMGPEEIARVRAGEAERAASILDGTYYCLGRNDLEITFDLPTRRDMAMFLRRLDPLIIFTSSPEDYMPDHEITSAIVHDAAFNATCPNYDAAARELAGLKQTSRVPYLYYMDAMEGLDKFGRKVRPSIYVDVEEGMDTKTRMLACHDSQRQWLREQHGMDHYIETMKSWTRSRGSEVGFSSAEAFRQHLGHAFPKENILEKILGKKVICHS